ncbi:hypothetical protein [Paraburkholderia tropica]|uniref:hypothetical protein n=1 Tax=Paraburkholderia tropica TaxID=92647 RepID=UPI003D2A300D
MLSIVDEILCVDEAQYIYLSFTYNFIEIKMSKILQAFADGKKVEGVIIKVNSTYPNAVFCIGCLVDGKVELEFADESLCEQIISEIGGVNQSEYQPYKTNKQIAVMRDKTNSKNQSNDNNSSNKNN